VDLDVLLVGPGGQNVMLLSDVGGQDAVSGRNLTFADGQPAVSTTSLPSGSYSPTDDDDVADTPFPAPAPAPTGATTMATFNANSANGTWSLYVNDDATGDSGSIGAWCLTITSQAPSATSLSVQPTKGPVGTSETFTATVTSSGDPVTTGSVSFFEITHGAHALLGSAPLNGSGQAVFTTSSLSAGRHVVQAEYGGTSAFSASTSPKVAVRVKPAADANGPYTITEGDSLHLSAAGSSTGGTVRWDVDGDGVYGDAVGYSPTLTWSQLQALGIQPGHSYRVGVKVKVGGMTSRDKTTLKVLPA
jgi:hypothetical protein